MNTRVMIFVCVLALLFFVYCYQNKADKKKHRKKSKKHHRRVTSEDKSQKKVRIDSNVEFKEDDIDNDLEYLSLSGMEESQQADGLSALDGVSDDTDISKYL